MAERLLKYYKHVYDSNGMAAKMQLAHETHIPSSKAAMEPDSEEHLRTFKAAVQRITGRPAPEF